MARRYGLIRHSFDFFMVLATGGLWLIWIQLRYLRTQ